MQFFDVAMEFEPFATFLRSHDSIERNYFFPHVGGVVFVNRDHCVHHGVKVSNVVVNFAECVRSAEVVELGCFGGGT